jgi:glycosyltransferase involved in cell wall biosynthesis
MRVCFLLSEIFAWGKYGGYGSMTRILATGLASKGVDVKVVVPRRPGQKSREKIDDIDVISYPAWRVFSSDLYKYIDADIYHSEEATISTYVAQKAMPDRQHLITIIDPWDLRDWYYEFLYDVKGNPKRGFIYPFLWYYYRSRLVKASVNRAESIFSQARFLIPKVHKLFNTKEPPNFLPNPYFISEQECIKAREPTVCYLGRWDPRKRPEFFFELAKFFPNVKFIAFGKAHNHKRDVKLRTRYSNLSNLELPGFIDQFKSNKFKCLLRKSWVLANTSIREGLPASFVEAASYRCAILSAVDSDDFASRGGFHVKSKNSINNPPELGGLGTSIEDFAEGLEWLLERDRWREKGNFGFNYVSDVHDLNKVVHTHISIYQSVLTGKND